MKRFLKPQLIFLGLAILWVVFYLFFSGTGSLERKRFGFLELEVGRIQTYRSQLMKLDQIQLSEGAKSIPVLRKEIMDRYTELRLRRTPASFKKIHAHLLKCYEYLLNSVAIYPVSPSLTEEDYYAYLKEKGQYQSQIEQELAQIGSLVSGLNQ